MSKLSNVLVSASLAMGLSGANAQDMPLKDLEEFEAATGLTLSNFIVMDDGTVTKVCTFQTGCMQISTRCDDPGFLCTIFAAQTGHILPENQSSRFRESLLLCREQGFIPQ